MSTKSTQQFPVNIFSKLAPAFFYVLSDFFALFVVWTCCILGKYFLFHGAFTLLLYWKLLPTLILFPVFYALLGLYTDRFLSPPKELKKTFLGTSALFLLLACAAFLFRQEMVYSRSIFLTAWLGSLLSIPLCRSLLRKKLQKKLGWGKPALVLGAGKTGQAVVQALQKNPRIGLCPTAFFDDDPQKHGKVYHGLTVLGSVSHLATLFSTYADYTVIIAMPGLEAKKMLRVLEGPVATFRRIILVPDFLGSSSLWVSAFDMTGILGLEVRRKLLDARRQRIKRFLELCLIAIGSPFIACLWLLIACSIKFDSPGPVLFRQQRVGFGGQTISLWKFRTMVTNAPEILKKYLQANPALQKEWLENQKLVHDPRITRIGHFLRRTSLDELPQFWNVLCGDMSLVGPRPIVREEIPRYKDGFSLYTQVRPGLTGFWQISGRSNTTYAERVHLDSYYVRNWSVWLDIYIIIKTPKAVLCCQGAY